MKRSFRLKVDKTLLGFFFVIGFISTIMILPRNGWGLVGDDFGAVYAGKRGCQSGIGQFWQQYPNDDIIYPSNVKRSHSFLSVFFRPLLLMLYTLEYKLFGGHSGWPYFVLSIFLHALAAGFVFLVFRRFFSGVTSMMLAISFGLFPLMGRFIGRISTQSYPICMIIAALCLFCFFNFLEKPKKWPALLASLMLFVSLLIHEILLFLPVAFALPIFFSNFNHTKKLRCFWFSASMAVACCLYMAVKAIAYPVNLSDNVLLSGGLGFKDRFYHLLTVLTDTLGMTGLDQGNGKLKLLVLSFFSIIFGLGFVFSKRRKTFLGLGCAFILACWPAIVFCHGHRYLYFSTPIFLAALAFAVQDLKSKLKPWKPNNLEALLPAILAIAGTFECSKSFSAFGHRSQLCFSALKTVGEKISDTQKSVCFVGVPLEIVSLWGSAQGIWLHTNSEVPVYYDNRLNAQSTFNNSVYSKTAEQNLLKISIQENRVNIESLDSEKIWLQMAAMNRTPELCDGIGTVSNFSCRSDGMLKAVSMQLDEGILNENPEFVSWDYENSDIVFLNNSSGVVSG